MVFKFLNWSFTSSTHWFESLLFAVNYGDEDGNGNLKTEERYVNQNFNEIIGSGGLEIYLTEGSENKIIVEADENLLEIGEF